MKEFLKPLVEDLKNEIKKAENQIKDKKSRAVGKLEEVREKLILLKHDMETKIDEAIELIEE